jgi:hypothetical protein
MCLWDGHWGQNSSTLSYVLTDLYFQLLIEYPDPFT